MPYKHSGDPAWESADGDPEGYGDPEPIDERDTPYHRQLARWDWESPNHGRVDNPPVVGVPWYKEFDREATDMDMVQTTTLPAGSLVLVEVHGLPHDDVKTFTYRATYDVQVGHQVQVPAPEWSVPVTGRDSLPGFVLGEAEEHRSGFTFRNILPGSETQANGDVKALITRWEESAKHYDELARHHESEADKAVFNAMTLRGRISEVQHAAGI